MRETKRMQEKNNELNGFEHENTSKRGSLGEKCGS
jgi:hypothetical protein